MKKCPTCQKTYDDNLRFCQIDGTPLVDDAPPPDPYATMVASKDEIMSAMPPKEEPKEEPPAAAASNEDDLLDIPEDNDMMKTSVVTEAERKDLFDEPSSKPIPPPSSGQDELQQESRGSEGDTLMAQPEPPKFNEPNLNPPNFGDAPSRPESSSKPPSPFGNEPPSFDKQPLPSDFEAQKKSDEGSSNAPIPSPFGDKMPPSYQEPSSSPPFAPQEFKEEEIKAEQLNTPFAEEVSQGNRQMAEQDNWTPPAVPDQNWQNQEIGKNTPLQPPPAGAGGENKTLAIVSLVLGVLSIPCCGFVLFGIAAVVTGFMAKGKATSNPKEYGGKGLAMAGIIIGALTTVLGIVINILYLVGMIALPNT